MNVYCYDTVAGPRKYVQFFNCRQCVCESSAGHIYVCIIFIDMEIYVDTNISFHRLYDTYIYIYTKRNVITLSDYTLMNIRMSRLKGAEAASSICVRGAVS